MTPKESRVIVDNLAVIVSSLEHINKALLRISDLLDKEDQ